eukprot:3364486-Prymnesium_polylepis.1
MGSLGTADGNDQLTSKVIEALGSVLRVCSVAAGGFHSLVLGAGGEMYSFGAGRFGQLKYGDRAHQLTPQVINDQGAQGRQAARNRGRLAAQPHWELVRSSRLAW